LDLTRFGGHRVTLIAALVAGEVLPDRFTGDDELRRDAPGAQITSDFVPRSIAALENVIAESGLLQKCGRIK